MKTLIALLFLVACPDPNETASDTDIGSDTDVDTEPDVANPYTFECDARALDMGNTTETGACTGSQDLGGGLTQRVVRPRCTDADITAVSTKQHMLVLPDAPSEDILWVHLPGTGGQPTQSQRFGTAVAGAGYRYIALAYPNDNNTTSRCTCPDGPRPASCKTLVRHEVITGEDVTPWFDMEADEAIIPRLEALLAFLHDERPGDGWDAYLDDDGHPVWSSIAMSGFSQGGLHVGRIARDHALDREVHFSSITDVVISAVLDPSAAQTCTSVDECDEGTPCCSVGEYPCDTSPEDAICVEAVHDPSAFLGADVDADGFGDGDVSTRATPLDRVFVFVHTLEPAWDQTPDVLDQWGLATQDDFIDVDTQRGPYPADARFFSTSLPPNGNCSYHQAMGPDACHSRDGNGDSVLLPAWRHVLRVE